MIINLLLIALICYYFKRKYENLEIAQNEQAKVLYQLLQNSPPKVRNLSEGLNDTITSSKVESKPSHPEYEDGSDSDNDSDSDSDNELTNLNNVVDLNEIKTINLDIDETELNELNVLNELKVDLDNIDVNPDKESESEVELNIEGTSETDYSKMTIKQLKEILSVKGINANKLKKNEMIDLIEKSSISIDE
jgi:hypothetical protein